VDWLKGVNDNETFSTAGLTPVEQRQILSQVTLTSFDTPDSWLSELRARRISLGKSDGLVVRATQLLCGGTGNCETWVFRRTNNRWVNMFKGEAPVVSGLGFVRQTAGIKDVVVSANESADKENWTQYAFDGKFYRPTVCYDVLYGGTKDERAEKVACRSVGMK
jgi:hypothetical protein